MLNFLLSSVVNVKSQNRKAVCLIASKGESKESIQALRMRDR